MMMGNTTTIVENKKDGRMCASYATTVTERD
jgi:hypothetical protein